MAFFDTPGTRADFEERMGVLAELCQTGRMRLVEGVGGDGEPEPGQIFTQW